VSSLGDSAAIPVVAALPPGALRPKDAARYLGVSMTTLRHLPIPSRRVFVTGQRKPIVLYLREDLDAWLEALRREPVY
jgi:hypothetical protein